MRSNLKVLHIITSTDVGGAENALYQLVAHADKSRFTMRVISLASKGPVANKIEADGIEVQSLEMKPGRFSIRAFFQLLHHIRSEKPDLIHCWMYHANLFGGFAGWLTRVPVVWGIHHHSAGKSHLKLKSIFILRLGALFSCIPKRILFVSENSLKAHIDLGFDEDKSIVTPNGVDTGHFRPNQNLGNSLRKKLGIPLNVPVIGHVGRFNPAKDHQTFIKASALIIKKMPQARFILCGKNVTEDNTQLFYYLETAGIKTEVHLLGEQLEMQGVYPAFDILIQSSLSEAFPLSLVEAMACGVPCVATNVGDSALIIGETGRLVTTGDHIAIAEKSFSLIKNKKLLKKLGIQARKRIIDKFQITEVTKSMEAIYEDVIKQIHAGIVR